MTIPSRLATAFLLSFAFLTFSATARAEIPVPVDDTTMVEDTAVVEHDVAESPAEVKAGYTRQDFLNAIPADGQVPPTADPAFDIPEFPNASVSARKGDFIVRDPSKLPQRLHGKVFFQIGNLTYSCSGTVISSRYGNAIYTAGHCVFDEKSKRFVKNLVFIPGYQEGSSAFGIYPAAKLLTTKGWKKRSSFSYDVGMAVLHGYPVRDLGGARPVAFNLNLKKRSYTLFGYPGDPAPIFDGEHLYGCKTKFAGRDIGRPRTMAAFPCYMGHGASGGAWITNGYLNSVNSYIYCETTPRACGFLFGPYFAKAAKRLFTSKAVGGSITPTIGFLKGPRRKINKKRVGVRFIGIASTPLRYNCRIDRRRWKRCNVRDSFRVGKGRHVLRVRAVDQTGRKSANKLKRVFRVVKR